MRRQALLSRGTRLALQRIDRCPSLGRPTTRTPRGGAADTRAPVDAAADGARRQYDPPSAIDETHKKVQRAAPPQGGVCAMSRMIVRSLAVVLYFVFALFVTPAFADGGIQPAGTEFEIAPQAGEVRVAMDSDGRFLTVWRSQQGAWGRLYDAPGTPHASAFVVNDQGTTFDASAAAGPTGPFVATFVRTGSMSSYALGLVVLDHTGNVLCREEVADTAYVAHDVAVTGAGQVLVAWEAGEEEAPHEIVARIFEPDGRPILPSFTLDTGPGDARWPRLARDGSAGFIALWTSSTPEGFVHLGRKFDGSGRPTTAVFDVGHAAHACADASGAFVSVWKKIVDDYPVEVWMQRFAPDGTPREVEQRVDGDAPSGTWAPRVACGDDGAFVVVWDSLANGGGYDIFARRYDHAGASDSPAFRVNEATARNQAFPDVSAGAAGEFVVTWWDDGPLPLAPARVVGRCFRVPSVPYAKGDFNGDGHPDLVLRRVDDGHLRVWSMHEAARLSNRAVWPPAPDWTWHLGGVNDFNADGHADLLFRHQLTGEVDLWLLGGVDGVERIAQATLTGAPLPSPEWIVAATADFDRDGRPDILWRNLVTHKLAVWLLAGTVWRQTQVPNPDSAADANWAVVAADDLDGDGLIDLLWYNVTSGRLVQWLLDASLTRRLGRFTSPDTARDSNWKVAAAADYGFGLRGQAGTSDVVWRNATTGKLVVWFMDTAGVRTSATFTNPDAPSDPLAWTVVGPR